MKYHVLLGHTAWQEDVAPVTLNLAQVFAAVEADLAAHTGTIVLGVERFR
jgi:hypothetical protein